MTECSFDLHRVFTLKSWTILGEVDSLLILQFFCYQKNHRQITGLFFRLFVISYHFLILSQIASECAVFNNCTVFYVAILPLLNSILLILFLHICIPISLCEHMPWLPVTLLLYLNFHCGAIMNIFTLFWIVYLCMMHGQFNTTELTVFL